MDGHNSVELYICIFVIFQKYYIMKKTAVIICIVFVVLLIIFTWFYFTLIEPLDNDNKKDVLEPGRSGQTPIVSVNTIAVDLSGGTTDLKYEPEEPVVLDDTVRYNSDNFDLTYHDLNKYAGLYETNLKNVQVWDMSSNHLVTLPYAPAQNSPVYYDTKKRVYGPFQPTYADSVLLSHYR